MKTSKPFRPTRMCPHRFCRPTHLTICAMGLIFVGKLLFGGLLWVLILALMTALGVVTIRAVHGGKTITEITTADIASRNSYLIVRKGWARAAVGGDLFMLAVGANVSYAVLALPLRDALPTSPGIMITGISSGVFVTGFIEYAHRKATQPAKPKRVLVPAQNGA